MCRTIEKNLRDHEAATGLAGNRHRYRVANWINHPDRRPPISLLQVDTFYSRPQESQKTNVQRPQTRLEPVSLPESWDTTTDAIAAVLAKHIGATELILLKSCEVDQRLTLAELAEAEIVDRSFPAAAVGIKSVSIEKLG